MHLLPEEFSRASGVCVIERAKITRTYPVANIVLYGLLIHPSVFVKLLVVVGRGVVFGPVGDEYACVVVVDIVYHALGVGEALRVELEAAPLVFFPVEPVLYHHVDRYLTLAELSEHTFHLSLCIVFLTALPESERPLWHDLCTSSEEAVAFYHVVEVVAGNEVVVHFLVHLSPYRHAALLGLSL